MHMLLEGMFHVNEIYLSHAIKEIKGKRKDPHTAEDGSFNKIKSITNCNQQNLTDRKAISVSITHMAQLHLGSKID